MTTTIQLPGRHAEAVAHLAQDGARNEHIAQAMGLGANTVANYISAACVQAGLPSRWLLRQAILDGSVVVEAVTAGKKGKRK